MRRVDPSRDLIRRARSPRRIVEATDQMEPTKTKRGRPRNDARELRVSVRLRDPVATQLEQLCDLLARHGERATYTDVLKTAIERLRAAT
jgi:hypothetical protein